MSKYKIVFKTEVEADNLDDALDLARQEVIHRQAEEDITHD